MQEMSELKQYVRQLYRHNADQLWREIISYADLGTMEDMKNVVHEAQRLGIRLIMDLVSNHVSEEHEWFQKAQAGDEKYRRYFIVQKTKPRFVGKFHKDSAVWARYIVNGKEVDVNIAFPEMAGEIPHWREGKDGYWYYHTYIRSNSISIGGSRMSFLSLPGLLFFGPVWALIFAWMPSPLSAKAPTNKLMKIMNIRIN